MLINEVFFKVQESQGKKKLAYSVHRPEGIEGDCTGSQGAQWTVVLEEEEKTRKLNFYLKVREPAYLSGPSG